MGAVVNASSIEMQSWSPQRLVSNSETNFSSLNDWVCDAKRSIVHLQTAFFKFLLHRIRQATFSGVPVNSATSSDVGGHRLFQGWHSENFTNTLRQQYAQNQRKSFPDSEQSLIHYLFGCKMAPLVTTLCFCVSFRRCYRADHGIRVGECRRTSWCKQNSANIFLNKEISWNSFLSSFLQEESLQTSKLNVTTQNQEFFNH